MITFKVFSRKRYLLFQSLRGSLCKWKKFNGYIGKYGNRQALEGPCKLSAWLEVMTLWSLPSSKSKKKSSKKSAFVSDGALINFYPDNHAGIGKIISLGANGTWVPVPNWMCMSLFYCPRCLTIKEPISPVKREIINTQTVYLIFIVHPMLSGSLPHWMPVTVSYSFWERVPIWPWLMV